MKIIYKISIALALVFGASSCNMDLRPISVIDPENALETYADAQKLANGFNIQIRSLAVGSKIYMPEIQADIFNASVDFGNRGGDMYRWEFTSSLDYAEALWAGCYTAIANANYFIEKAGSVKERVKTDADFADTWTKEELALLDGHIGEALFVRAYAHSFLVDRFCATYSAETADDENSGIPIVLNYVPTSDKEKYPSRNTLAECYGQIMSDLNSAEELIGALRAPAAGSAYVTVDAVKALRARLALASQDYSLAIQDATSIISSGTYGLVSGVEKLTNLFVNDAEKSECIMQCFVSKPDELPSSNNYGYVSYNFTKKTYSPDFIPAQWVIDLYDDKDYRKEVFFMQTPLTYGTGESEPLYIFNKYIGNRALETGESSFNYMNAPKPFRLAELYLIAAEAYLESGIDEAAASDLINEFKATRVEGWVKKTYTASMLRDEIRNERVRELIGEGFRLSDLKRYGLGITRKASQNSGVINFPGDNRTEFLKRDANDYRFVWPIPTTETDSNPKIKQNPGYTNN